ncbi:MAG: nuclear transport factor 2 family protein [Chloroflexota bacterium]|nr:MAG: nuclear transport factor 2 family protein [Chloroflexota bacterium]
MKTKMISISSRYFEALSNLDRGAYLNCFAADAELHDPYGGRPFAGRTGLEKWFTGMDRTWSEFAMRPGACFVSGDRIAVQWQAEGLARSGKRAEFAGVNVFTVDEDGLISRLEGYWDFAALLDQIQ